jgi:hypothetical protein
MGIQVSDMLPSNKNHKQGPSKAIREKVDDIEQ